MTQNITVIILNTTYTSYDNYNIKNTNNTYHDNAKYTFFYFLEYKF